MKFIFYCYTVTFTPKGAGNIWVSLKASNGWIDWMKKRHNLVYRLLSRELSSIDDATIEEWKKNLPNLTKECIQCGQD